MGIIFGVIQMGYEEIYWTEDYYKYAILVRDKEVAERDKKVLELREKEPIDTGNDTTNDIG